MNRSKIPTGLLCSILYFVGLGFSTPTHNLLRGAQSHWCFVLVVSSWQEQVMLRVPVILQ